MIFTVPRAGMIEAAQFYERERKGLGFRFIRAVEEAADRLHVRRHMSGGVGVGVTVAHWQQTQAPHDTAGQPARAIGHSLQPPTHRPKGEVHWATSLAAHTGVATAVPVGAQVTVGVGVGVSVGRQVGG